MYFFIFQPKDMPNLNLHFNEPQPTHIYKHYVYNKRVFYILLLILVMNRGKSFAFRSLKCQKACFLKDFNVNRYINFDLKY